MIDEGFFSLTPGSIGVFFYKVSPVDVSEEQQKHIDQNTNAIMRQFMMNSAYGITKGDPYAAFSKARQEAKDFTYDVESIHVQVNQKESFDVIEKIEQDGRFMGWIDPFTVEMFKSMYNSMVAGK